MCFEYGKYGKNAKIEPIANHQKMCSRRTFELSGIGDNRINKEDEKG
jgi:hypothetical protein